MTALAPFTPTDEQLAVCDAVAQRHGSVMVEAGAGCAKTSTLELAAQRVREPALVLAFNKSVAEAAKRVLPRAFSVRSFNSLGHLAWSRAIGKELELDDRKVGRLVTATAQNLRLELSADQWDAARSLVAVAMREGLVPDSDQHGEASLVPDTAKGWAACAALAGLDSDDTELVWELAREVLMQSIEQARRGKVSFDDQVYCSSMLGGKFPQFPVVFVDEDQDLNPLNIRMLGQSMRSGGRIIAVGDKRQAIYAWRGACGDSAERIRAVGLERGSTWTDLPLLTTFRCPRAVVARQQSHVPGFRAAPSCVDGQVEDFTRLPEGQWTWQQLIDVLPFPGASLAVLCRNNAPLVALAIKLIRQGIGVEMLGRDIGKGLVKLSKKVAPEDDMGRAALRARIAEWQGNEIVQARAAGQSGREDSITDRAECLLAVMDFAECQDARQLRIALRRVFEPAPGAGSVTLSSIHRAKGLEWDCVMLLDGWRIEPVWLRRRAIEQPDGQAPAQLAQERNLRYVAETRTRHTLVLANLEDFR